MQRAFILPSPNLSDENIKRIVISVVRQVQPAQKKVTVLTLTPRGRKFRANDIQVRVNPYPLIGIEQGMLIMIADESGYQGIVGHHPNTVLVAPETFLREHMRIVQSGYAESLDTWDVGKQVLAWPRIPENLARLIVEMTQ